MSNNQTYPWKPSKYIWEEFCKLCEEMALKGMSIYEIAKELETEDVYDVVDALNGSNVIIGA